MPFSAAAIVVASNAIRTAIKGIQLHGGNPGEGGVANKRASTAKQPNWSTVAADGSFNLASPLQFTGAGANAAVTWLSLWSSTNIGGATWYGNVELTGDKTADSGGNYTLQSLTVNGSSS